MSKIAPHGFSLGLIANGKVDPKYLCGECCLILRQPVQGTCGHRFCRQCVEYLLRSNDGKPVQCKQCVKEEAETLLDQTYPDNAIKRELNSLPAKCQNEGCGWTGRFKDYQKHEPDCKYKKEPCDLCGTPLDPQKIAQHQAEDCPKRSVICRYCQLITTGNKINDHHKVCPKFPVDCEYCGKKAILREKLISHAAPGTGDCTTARVPCVANCGQLVEPNHQQQHLQQDLLGHFQAITQQIGEITSATQGQGGRGGAAAAAATTAGGASPTLLAKIQEVEAQQRQLEQKIAVITRRLDELPQRSPTEGATGGQEVTAAQIREAIAKTEETEQKVDTYERVVAIFKRELERSAEQLERHETSRRADREKLTALEKKVQTLERTMAMKEVTIADHGLRLQSLESACYDGTLIWKITDFVRRRQDAIAGRVTSIYSPPFYTGRTGYKMCARIYLNGDGMGKGTHISMFFVLMRGDYDALLSWPFRQKVTLMLLDHNNREHIVDAFRPDPTSTSFKRPTSDMNIASGCPLFMPLSHFDSPHHQYAKDDTIFIKIVVDNTGLNQ